MTIFASGRGATCRPKAAGAAPASPSIIGSPVVSVNSTSTHSSGTVAITPTTATELVVVAVMITGNAADGDNHLSSVSSDLDGALTIAIDGPDTGAGSPDLAANARPGWGIAWFKPTTKNSEHTITYTVQTGAAAPAAMTYSAAIAMNIKDIETADPVGNARSICSDVSSLSETDSITIETVDCLLLTFGCAQGNDTDPFTADLGGSLLTTGDTGGGSTSADGGYGAAEEIINTTGATNYGFSWSSSDGWGIAAIEVRNPP